MKKEKRWTALLLGLLAALLLFPVQALAAGSIDTEQKVQLTISYKNGETALFGAQFDVYKVAAVDVNGELTAIAPFDQFNVVIRGRDDEAWKALATTLEGYVLRDAIAPTASGKTDLQGQLTFPELEQGLYLVLGHRHTQNGRIYDAAPSMVLLPAQDVQTNEWLYVVTVEPKHDSEPEPNHKTITRKVLKVWKDQGNAKSRPQEIVVQLLREGKVYDTVNLNASNNWRYTWESLDDKYTWTVVEEKVPDYTVTVTQEGVTFVVTNTYTEKTPDDPVPPATPDEPALPQTGQLWWPVPMLLAGGLLFVVLGLLRHKGTKNEK